MRVTVVVLCNLHVCYRYSFAYTDYYIKFYLSQSSGLDSINSGMPLDKRFVRANLKCLWEYGMHSGI